MQAESAATTGSHLTWLDLLLAATLSLVAFGAGGLVLPARSIPFEVQVEPRVVYDARHGVSTRRDELAIIETRQTKLRERIASEYVALAADSGSTPADDRKRLIRSLESEAEMLATRQLGTQVELAKAESAATKAEDSDRTRDRWLAHLARAVLSFLALGVFGIVLGALVRAFHIPVSSVKKVVGVSIPVLAALVVADTLGWVKSDDAAANSIENLPIRLLLKPAGRPAVNDTVSIALDEFGRRSQRVGELFLSPGGRPTVARTEPEYLGRGGAQRSRLKAVGRHFRLEPITAVGVQRSLG